MRVLFIHQNFPGQYRHIAAALARQGHEVKALGMQLPTQPWQGVDYRRYGLARGPLRDQHRMLVEIEAKVLRGEAVAAACHALDGEGFRPDLICVHPAWGEALFLRAVWPSTAQLHFVEMYYRAEGQDLDFDPELMALTPGARARLPLKNMPLLHGLEAMDHGVCPTRYQASTLPSGYLDKLSIIHDGIDTQRAAPLPGARFRAIAQSGTRLDLGAEDEVLSFVNRNLEPQRGYHRFMRALPSLLRRRPRVQVVIVGGNGPGYGRVPDQGTWQQQFLEEIRPQLPDGALARIHFVGRLTHDALLALFQVTRAHVYLTYPFVLSWSLLEAMACGAWVIGSDTAPVREVVEDGVSGRLVDFFDTDALVERCCEALAQPPGLSRFGQAARRRVQASYDLQRVCLPQQLALIAAMPDRVRGSAGSALSAPDLPATSAS